MGNKPSDSQWHEEAAKMADRLERQREAGQQLGLPGLKADEPPVPVEPVEGDGRGRPKGSKNKNTSQVREWMAHRGLRMPEDVLTDVMGVATDLDATMHAMAQTERLLGWAFDAGTPAKGGAEKPTPHQFLETFKFFYSAAVRAADALLPYVAPKASLPDGGERPAVHIHMPPQPGQEAPKDVTPVPDRAPTEEPWMAAARRDGRISEIVQDQQVSDDEMAQDSSDRRSVPENDGKSDE